MNETAVMTSAQVREIVLGTIHNVDTTNYDNISYTALVMEIIRKSLERGINLTRGFSDWTKLSDQQLKCIKIATDKGLNVKCLLNIDFTEDQLNELIHIMENGINPIAYAEPVYSAECMHEYALAMEHGIDVTLALDPRLELDDLRVVLKALMKKQYVSDKD